MNASKSNPLVSPAMAGSPGDGSPTMTQLATLSIWGLFAAVGVIGVIWRNPPAHSDRVAPRPAPVTIDVTTAMPASPAADDSPAPPQPAPPDPLPALPAAPPAVAEPAPNIALAIPTPDGPRIVAPAVAAIAPPAQLVRSTVAPRPNAPPTAPHRIVLGQGEGKYIQLAYPEEAQLAGEEGTVEVQFTQDNAGHVTDARIVSPSRWPILNAAALRAIRQTRFPPGNADNNVITIEFKLQ